MYQTTGGPAADHIKITMFGEFSICVGDKQIRDSAARTHQLWHLIEYLIAFRHKTILQDELIEVLWPGSGIDNPANALKNLVYRARSIFNTHGLPHAKEMILSSRGGYRWNNNLPCIVDAEQFDRACKLTELPDQPLKQQIVHYQDAICLYKGDYLPAARFEIWVAPIASNFRKQYFQCVYAVLDIFSKHQRYPEMQSVCEKAVGINPFDETVQYYLLLSLVRQGYREQAISHYSVVTDLFFRELGVTPSASIRSLYHEISKSSSDSKTDLEIVKEDLKESGQADGAFYCEYEVFKSLYRLEARVIARTGQSIFIGLLTMENAGGKIPSAKLRNKIMDNLHNIIRNNLRKGDVFSRFSSCQYVLMIPTLTYENCVMVIDRIVKRFRNAHHSSGVSLLAKIQPLDPIETLGLYPQQN